MEDFCNRLISLRNSLKLSQQEFGAIFDYSSQQISNFETGYRKPTKRFINLVKNKYGENFGLPIPETENQKPNTVPYPQPTEGPHLVSSADAGSYGQPDLSQHRVTQVFEPEVDMYVNMTRKILTSGQIGTINALKSNLIAFHEQVHDKAQLKAMGENLDKLNKEIRTLKTITGGCAETSADRETGNE